jgi:hypothetical protein
MFPPQCPFCDHVNPAGAKFCTDCGSPLRVKQCSRCKALNDPIARICSKCSAQFPSEAGQTASAQGITAASPAFSEGLPFRLDFDLNEFTKPAPSAANVTAAAPASVASESAFEIASSTAPQLARPAAAIELDQVDPVREPRSLGTAVTSPLTAAQRVTANVPLRNLAATELRPKSRAALAVSLPLVALGAIGIFAYYLYSHSGQRSDRQGSQAVSAADVAASPPPSASAGTGSVGATGTAKPAPPDEPSAAVTISPVGQGTTATSGSNGGGSQTLSPNEPHRQVSTSDQVSPSQQSAAKAEGVVKKPSAATADAGALRDRTTPVAGNEVTAKHSATNPPMRRYPAPSVAGSVQSPPSDGRANVRPELPRPCTEGVAALGLCSPNSRGEGK